MRRSRMYGITPVLDPVDLGQVIGKSVGDSSCMVGEVAEPDAVCVDEDLVPDVRFVDDRRSVAGGDVAAIRRAPGDGRIDPLDGCDADPLQ